MSNNYPTEKLIPKFTANEQEDLLIFQKVYEKYVEDFSKKALEDLKDHPDFGKILSDIPKDTLEKMNQLSRSLQEDAIHNKNWKPYVEYQIEQGVNFAKMGLSFKAWYEVVALLRNYLNPYLFKEFDKIEDLLSAINGMNIFLDVGMSLIGEAYVHEKELIIKKDQEKIKKFNKELERKVQNRTKELKAANKELEAFSYSVSHDLRAPLRAINGFSEILMEDYAGKLDKDGKRIVNTICRNATKMGKLIDDLLEFSRLGRKELRITKIDMDKMLDEVLKHINLSYENQAKIELSNILDVKADRGLFYQLLFNLISNAVKYSSKVENPKVCISSEKKGQEIIYSIKDNGAGFDMAYANKLFGVFQRLHSQEEFEGTGVGLAIVHRIISRHNGRIWADSKLNEGAEFKFSLAVN